MEDKSTYQMSSSLNEAILEIIFTGELTRDLHDKIVNDVFAAITENNTKRVLIDISVLKGRFGIADTYHRVRSFPSHIYNMRFAMVNVHGQNEIEQFQETTAINAGISVKWFTDINAARAWLRGNKKI